VSKVLLHNDSVLFDGNLTKKHGKVVVSGIKQTTDQIPRIDYSLNSVTFHFAALFFEDADYTDYQYMLEGFDKAWSKWSNDTKAIYTNLPNGHYTFKVRARNAYITKSNVATYTFIISPPWYKTIWAYLFYVALVGYLFYISVKYYTARLRNQKEKLEKTVIERTAEISRRSAELASANEKLLELNTFKQGVTSMIVHDLKNPINAVINASETDPALQLKGIKLRGKQMLNMVLNILDIYKYEEAEIQPDKTENSLTNIILEAVKNIRFLADEKNITIVCPAADVLRVNVDYEMILRAVENILTNAVKFSYNNSQIRISAESFDNGPLDEPFVKISVTDTGIGIPADKKHLVFEKFGQVKARNSGSVKSTGLGLTYCKMVIEAHHGIIDVDSIPGEGSVFWFTLPLVTLKSTQNLTDQHELVFERKINQLSKQNYQQIKQVVNKLRNTEIYKISEISRIFGEISYTVNDEIDTWRSDVMKAVDSGNESLYRKLLEVNENEGSEE
jgi:signal transduction histidine kinase